MMVPIISGGNFKFPYSTGLFPLLHHQSIKNHVIVQSNQKMHDLYATKHIFQMALPDAFWAVWSQIFS